MANFLNDLSKGQGDAVDSRLGRMLPAAAGLRLLDAGVPQERMEQAVEAFTAVMLGLSLPRLPENPNSYGQVFELLHRSGIRVSEVYARQVLWLHRNIPFSADKFSYDAKVGAHLMESARAPYAVRVQELCSVGAVPCGLLELCAYLLVFPDKVMDGPIVALEKIIETPDGKFVPKAERDGNVTVLSLCWLNEATKFGGGRTRYLVKF